MSSTKVVINLPHDEKYDVRIGPGLLEGIGEYMLPLDAGEKVCVITDSHVGELYLERVKKSFIEQGRQVIEIKIPAGEQSKSVECIAEIWEALAQAGFSRDMLVCALGGGVVGDIAGFVAATYMRGVDYVQVPTTLLAMVDSSVGGKTGIDLSAGKNLVGAFKQPRYVCASIDTLNTLPDSEWVCGCAEIAKSAVIDSDDFFFWLCDSAEDLMARNQAVVSEAIARCVVFKANVVAADTFESKGVRESLNYGHTFGHAIETLAGFGTFSHGVAVAEGMRFAARLGAVLVDTSPEFIQAQDSLLDSLQLPEIEWSASPEELLRAMKRDKKVRKSRLRFVLPRDVGQWELVEVEDDVVLEHIGAWQRSKSASL
ncbi:MAG: 3-dehydroquinate synthase [Raoultibacter sp.]